MRTSWNDEEDLALQGLPWMAQLLYLRGLRPYMDYASGVVGIKRGISYQGLAETLYREAGQGKHEYGSPTLSAIRNGISVLEKAGLLIRIEADRRLIFELVLATRDDSVSEKYDRRTTDVRQTRRDRPITKQNNSLTDNNDRRTTDPIPEKCDTPPVSGIRKESLPTELIERERNNARGARLALSSLPAEWRDWANRERPDLDADATWQIFHDHWIAIAGTRGCKSDWLATWRNWVRRETASPGGHNGHRYESAAEKRAKINRTFIEAGQRAFDEMDSGSARPLRGDLAQGVGG